MIDERRAPTASSQHTTDPNRLLEQGIDLSLPPDALRRMSYLMGYDVTQPVDPDRVRRAQEWIRSPNKRMLEAGLCRMFARLGGTAFTSMAARRIDRTDPGHGGFVRINVGFLGTDGPIMYPIVKIRTMVPGAPGLRQEVFQHTSFRAGLDQTDSRVLDSDWARFLRRTGLDEAPQVAIQIPNREMQLVGLRGYTEPELEGTAQIIALRHDPRLPFSPLTRRMLGEYQATIDVAQPRIAFSGLLQAMQAKETPHLVRMFGDISYLNGASPGSDFRIAVSTVLNRVRGVGAW